MYFFLKAVVEVEVNEEIVALDSSWLDWDVLEVVDWDVDVDWEVDVVFVLLRANLELRVCILDGL